MDKNLTIYSVYHKLFDQPSADFVIPVHAGKAIAKSDLPYVGDNTGDNISALNAGFCELTVLYWVWKNKAHKPDDIWGIFHYRRCFTLPQQGFFTKKKKVIEKKASLTALNTVINESLKDYILKSLTDADVIIHYPIRVSGKKKNALTVEEHYNQDHIAEHWKITKEVIIELYPDYAESLTLFSNGHTMSFTNMMISRGSVWNSYLNWLFNILFELEKRITIPEDVYQARVFGFIAERIVNLYLAHNKLRLTHLPMVLFK